LRQINPPLEAKLIMGHGSRHHPLSPDRIKRSSLPRLQVAIERLAATAYRATGERARTARRGLEIQQFRGRRRRRADR
jgi:hypothetical protein